ncbi:hypothetical protein BA952_01050 [Candidatus Portiera aleyrodidarum]|nr:hypothetical protein BA952_01050 [Candidatus Portiera aleyrodidarum]AUI73324.1 hypothetical protein BBB03_01075 [Candidatus Portiera aleyrodidarum]
MLLKFSLSSLLTSNLDALKLCKSFMASRFLFVEASHLGLAGINNMQKNKSIEGTIKSSNILLQFCK